MKFYLQFCLGLLIIYNSITSFAQPYFNNIYSNEWHIETSWEIDINNNNNIIQLSTRKMSIDSVKLGLNQINIREIDPNTGKLLWEDFIANDSIYLTSDGTHQQAIIGSTLYIINSAQQFVNKDSLISMPSFIEYDLDEQKLLKMKFYPTEKRTYLNSTIFHQGYFYAVGYQYPYWEYKDKDCFLMKMDLDGNIIWQKIFDFGQDEQMYEIEVWQEELLVTGFHTNDYWTKPYFMQIDTAGNELERAESVYFGVYGTLEIEIHHDHIYFLTGVNRKVEKYFTQYLAKYDTSFNLVWDTLIHNTSRYDITCRRMEILNDQIIIISNIKKAWEFTNDKIWSHAASWSLDGEFNWEHALYYDKTYRHQVDDVAAMPNGDLIFMGTIYAPNSDKDDNIFSDKYLWLFRTDSLGCGTVQPTCYYTLDDYFMVDTITNIVEPAYSQHSPVKILGNPFTNNLQVKAINNKALQLQFYNTAGKLLATENLNSQLNINTQNWPTGIYFMQVFNKEKLLAVEKVVKR